MIKKMKEYFTNKKEYNEAKKALTLMLLNQYSDFLVAETEAKVAEKDAYEKLGKFGEEIDMNELQNALVGINKIAKSPELTTDYYKAIHDEAQAEKKLKAVK